MKYLTLALLLATSAQAQDIIPKVKSCPIGYRTSGGYCIPLKDKKQEVVIKIKSCPVGYRTSGSYCIKLK